MNQDGSGWVQEARKASPTTLYEFLYWTVLFVLGIVILLRPDDLWIVSGINPVSLLEQPGWVGLAIVLGSPNILLITQFGKWVYSD